VELPRLNNVTARSRRFITVAALVLMVVAVIVLSLTK